MEGICNSVPEKMFGGNWKSDFRKTACKCTKNSRIFIENFKWKIIAFEWEDQAQRSYLQAAQEVLFLPEKQKEGFASFKIFKTDKLLNGSLLS